MPRRSRVRDGAGKGPLSYRKHHLFHVLAAAQVATLNLISDRADRPRGCLFDMHAADGMGGPTPQGDLFDENLSQSTAALCLWLADRCSPAPHIVLCERNREKRAALTARFGDLPDLHILSNNNQISELLPALGDLGWTFTLNDPCGHSGHNLEMMCAINRCCSRSDFGVSVNVGSVQRHCSVGATGTDDHLYANAHLIARVRASNQQYAWMPDPLEWCRHLNKRFAVASRGTVNNSAYRGQLMLLTNYVAVGLRRHRDFEVFER